MLSFILQLILTVPLVQIAAAAAVGAIIGESQREVDDEDELRFSKFAASFASSSFGGLMVGLFLRGTIAKDNVYLAASGAGTAGFLGHGVSFKVLRKVLLGMLKEPEAKKPKENEETQKKE